MDEDERETVSKSSRSQSKDERPAMMFNDVASFIARVDSSSDDHCILYLDSSRRHWPKGEGLPPQPNLGGLSREPCFLIVPAEERIEFARLIQEGQTELELVRVQQANLVDAKGMIEPELWPKTWFSDRSRGSGLGAR